MSECKFFRNRLRTLLSVDTLVDGLLSRLDLTNTFVIFTSDHGFHLGQFRLPYDKRQPYETDLRVPLWVRGPGVPANVTLDALVAMTVDLAPTLLDMGGAGQAAKRGMDGTSFLPNLRQANKSAVSNEGTHDSQMNFGKSFVHVIVQ